jgi:hypothetical protein
MELEKQLTAQSGLSELWAGSKKTRFFMNGEHVPDDHECCWGCTYQK